MKFTFSYWLLLPIGLSIFYGYTQSRAKAAMKLPARRVWAGWLMTTVVTASLTGVWSAVGYFLPILYLLAYLCQSVLLLTG